MNSFIYFLFVAIIPDPVANIHAKKYHSQQKCDLIIQLFRLFMHLLIIVLIVNVS